MSRRTDRTAIRDSSPSLSKRHEKVPLLSPSMSSAARVSLSLFRLGYRRRLACDSNYAVRHVFVEADTRPHSSDILPHRYNKFMYLRSFSSDGKTVPHAKDEVEETARLATADDPDDQNNSKIELIYEGTLASHVRSLKRISISTCIISILAVPALAIWGTDNVPMAGQVAVMGTAMAGTGCSTLLLNICVSPYVIRMAEVITDANGEGDDPSSMPENKLNRRPSMPRLMGRRFLAERMNIFGLSTTSEFYIDEVEPTPKSSRPFASFRVDGKYYYIQGNEMADKALLRTLLGRELKEHEK